LKEFNTENLRNIAFIGHGGSGKTTLTEAILYIGNEINRIGRVEEGNTTSDYNSYEIERQISIYATPLHLVWNNVKINLIDTPGYTDFIGQVKSALRVVDVAIPVLKSADGIEVNTETTWEFAKEEKLPSAFIINKVDNEHSKFFETYNQIKDRLSSEAIIVTFPVKEGLAF